MPANYEAPTVVAWQINFDPDTEERSATIKTRARTTDGVQYSITEYTGVTDDDFVAAAGDAIDQHVAALEDAGYVAGTVPAGIV